VWRLTLALARIDELFREVQDTRTTLLAKIDTSVHDLIAKLRTCEDMVADHNTRIDAVEHTQAAMTTQIAALLALLTAPNPIGASTGTVPTGSAAPASVPLAINDVVRELDRRASKRANIVLRGVKASPLPDAEIVVNLLRDELGITTTVTRCIRLGRVSADPTRPCLLLATLSSENDAVAAVCSASKLRRSADENVRDNIYLNADLTPEQRKLDYDLRTELKRRRAAGERDLVIRDGRLVTKTPRPVANVSAAGGP
jgi:hypothetical protein